MAVTSELAVLHRTVDELRSIIGTVRSHYGDIPAVKRLLNDLERIDIDAAELDVVPVPATPAGPEDVHIIDDAQPDPALWADADDEGVGGYHRGGSQ